MDEVTKTIASCSSDRSCGQGESERHLMGPRRSLAPCAVCECPAAPEICRPALSLQWVRTFWTEEKSRCRLASGVGMQSSI